MEKFYCFFLVRFTACECDTAIHRKMILYDDFFHTEKAIKSFCIKMSSEKSMKYSFRREIDAFQMMHK